MADPRNLQKQVWEQLIKKASEFIEQANNSYQWAKDFLGVHMYSNQVEVFDAVYDLNNSYVVVIGARGAGKSYSTCVGLIRLAVDNPGIEIGIFGPRADQAIRLIFETKKILGSSALKDKVDWDRTTAEKLVFHNGSYMLGLSAAETSLQEGWHFSVVVVDEAHRVTNASLSQRIIPMLGSKKIFKLIKIGIPLFKNHFYQSFSDSKYKIVKHDWLNAPILLEPGYKEINGKKYPTKILDRMPRHLKVKMFPNNPELHTDGDMTEIEFNTQYGMIWMDDINTFLSSEDMTRLVGDKPMMARAQAGEQYFYGLDTSSGSLMPGKYDLDFTALSIWRKTSSGIKEKIYVKEWQGGESLAQLEEAMRLVHPSYGMFPCTFGCIDYSNVGITAVEMFKREKIPVAGVLFSATEPSSHKNYKNAMAHQFKFELQSDRIKYPRQEDIETNRTLRKHYHEWMALEKHVGLGINEQIAAPQGLHDDGVMSDILAVWAADRGNTFKHGVSSLTIPGSTIAPSIMSPGQNRGVGRRFLK